MAVPRATFCVHMALGPPLGVVEAVKMRFSADPSFRLLFALFPTGKRTKKLLKNELDSAADNLHVNHAQKPWKSREFAEDSAKSVLVQSLRISFGELADKRRNTGGKATHEPWQTRPCK